jgi:hypothetical protein
MSTDRRNGERGASLLEFCLVSVLFFLIIFGIIEIALFVNAYITVGRMVKEGAKELSTGGASAYSDYNAIHAIKKAATISTNNIDYIIVYKADPAHLSQIPAGCDVSGSLSGNTIRGVHDKCNIYSKDVFSLHQLDFGCVNATTLAHQVDWNYCPWDTTQDPSVPNRQDGIDEHDTTGSYGLDTVGVKIGYHYDSATNFIIGSHQISSTSAAQIEPSHYDS